MVKPITKEEVVLVWETYVTSGRNAHEAARALAVPQSWLNRRLQKAREFFEDTKDKEEQFYIDKSALPDEVADLDDILELRIQGLEVVRLAPLGDPMELKVRGFLLSVRKAEAAHVEIEAA
mgnify:CR=1 FL=1